MENIVNILNNLVLGTVCYSFLIIVYGYALYNTGKFLVYVFTQACKHVKKDIRKWKSDNKNNQ